MDGIRRGLPGTEESNAPSETTGLLSSNQPKAQLVTPTTTTKKVSFVSGTTGSDIETNDTPYHDPANTTTGPSSTSGIAGWSCWQHEVRGYRLTPATALFHAYTAFSMMAALCSLWMLLLQCLSFSILKRGEFFTDDVCRIFCMFMATLFILVELPATSFLLPVLHNWSVRGFCYCFVASVSALVAKASLYHELTVPSLTEQLTVAVIQWNGMAVFAIGVAYFVLGLFCMKGLVEGLVKRNAELSQQGSEVVQQDDTEDALVLDATASSSTKYAYSSSSTGTNEEDDTDDKASKAAANDDAKTPSASEEEKVETLVV